MFKRALLSLAACVGLVAALSSPLHAQSIKSIRAWGDGSLGLSFAIDGAGGSARAGLHVLVGRFMAAGRITENNGGASEERGLYGPYHDEVSEQALLFGYAHTDEKNILTVGAGPSRVSGRRFRGTRRSGDFGSISPSRARVEDIAPTFGLAWEAGVVRRVWTLFGLSLTLHGNVNGEESFGAVTVGVTVGKMR